MPSRPIHHVINDRKFVCVAFDTPVREVTRLMLQHNESAALVTEHGVLTGIFTERDALTGCWPPDWIPTRRQWVRY